MSWVDRGIWKTYDMLLFLVSYLSASKAYFESYNLLLFRALVWRQLYLVPAEDCTALLVDCKAL